MLAELIGVGKPAIFDTGSKLGHAARIARSVTPNMSQEVRVVGYVVDPYVNQCFFDRKSCRGRFRGDNELFLYAALQLANLVGVPIQVRDEFEAIDLLDRGLADVSVNIVSMQTFFPMLQGKNVIFSHPVFSYRLAVASKLIKIVDFDNFWMLMPFPKVFWVVLPIFALATFLVLKIAFRNRGYRYRGEPIGVKLVKNMFGQGSQPWTNATNSAYLIWTAFSLPMYLFLLGYAAVIFFFTFSPDVTPKFATKREAIAALQSGAKMLQQRSLSEDRQNRSCLHQVERYFAKLDFEDTKSLMALPHDAREKAVECTDPESSWDLILDKISSDSNYFTIGHFHKIHHAISKRNYRSLHFSESPLQAAANYGFMFQNDRNSSATAKFQEKFNAAVDFLTFTEYWQQIHENGPSSQRKYWNSNLRRPENKSGLSFESVIPVLMLWAGMLASSLIVLQLETFWKNGTPCSSLLK